MMPCYLHDLFTRISPSARSIVWSSLSGLSANSFASLAWLDHGGIGVPTKWSSWLPRLAQTILWARAHFSYSAYRWLWGKNPSSPPSVEGTNLAPLSDSVSTNRGWGPVLPRRSTVWGWFLLRHDQVTSPVVLLNPWWYRKWVSLGNGMHLLPQSFYRWLSSPADGSAPCGKVISTIHCSHRVWR